VLAPLSTNTSVDGTWSACGTADSLACELRKRLEFANRLTTRIPDGVRDFPC